MKRAPKTEATVCRLVATRHPSGTSKKTGEKYDAFTSFKIHDGDKVTDFRFMKNTDITDILEAVDAGATTFDVELSKVYRFEKDASHPYPVVIGGGYNPDATICYDAPEDSNLPF